LATFKAIAPLAETIVPVTAYRAFPRLRPVPVRPPVRHFPAATVHYQQRIIRVSSCAAVPRRAATGGRGGRRSSGRQGGARPGMPSRLSRPCQRPRRSSLGTNRRFALNHTRCPCLPRRDLRGSPPGRPRDGRGLRRGRTSRRLRPGGGERCVLRPLLPGGGVPAPAFDSAPVGGASSGSPRHAGVIGTFCFTPRRRPFAGQLAARITRRPPVRGPLGRRSGGPTCAAAHPLTAWASCFDKCLASCGSGS